MSFLTVVQWGKDVLREAGNEGLCWGHQKSAHFLSKAADSNSAGCVGCCSRSATPFAGEPVTDNMHANACRSIPIKLCGHWSLKSDHFHGSQIKLCSWFKKKIERCQSYTQFVAGLAHSGQQFANPLSWADLELGRTAKGLCLTQLPLLSWMEAKASRSWVTLLWSDGTSTQIVQGTSHQKALLKIKANEMPIKRDNWESCSAVRSGGERPMLLPRLPPLLQTALGLLSEHLRNGNWLRRTCSKQ